MLSRFLSNRDADTGDLLYYRDVRRDQALTGVVIRVGRDMIGGMLYEVMPTGKPYFEDQKGMIPLALMRLDMPDEELVRQTTAKGLSFVNSRCAMLYPETDIPEMIEPALTDIRRVK
jgi:hypothetical protein